MAHCAMLVPTAEPVTDSQAVDQHEVQHDVQRKPPCHHQRRAGVLQSPEHARAGKNEQHRDQPGHGPAQVVHGKYPHSALGAHEPHQRSAARNPAAPARPPAAGRARRRRARRPAPCPAGRRRAPAPRQEWWNTRGRPSAQHRYAAPRRQVPRPPAGPPPDARRWRNPPAERAVRQSARQKRERRAAGFHGCGSLWLAFWVERRRKAIGARIQPAAGRISATH